MKISRLLDTTRENSAISNRCFDIFDISKHHYHKVENSSIFNCVQSVEATNSVGCVRYCVQVRARRYEPLNVDDDGAPGTVSNLFSSQFIDVLLSIFLFVWFICGNYWVLSVWPPNYHQTLAEPNSWCDKTTYVFALVQLGVCYGLMLFIILLTGLLVICQQVWTSQM